MTATVWARVQGWLAFAGAALATLGVAYLAGRRDARADRDAEAARGEQHIRRMGDAEARDAERAGAAERMRRGDF